MNAAEFSNKLETITTINITPFDEKNREIDWEGLEANIEFLIAGGAEVIVPCGNTSEFYALTWMNEGRDRRKRSYGASGTARGHYARARRSAK